MTPTNPSTVSHPGPTSLFTEAKEESTNAQRFNTNNRKSLIGSKATIHKGVLTHTQINQGNVFEASGHNRTGLKEAAELSAHTYKDTPYDDQIDHRTEFRAYEEHEKKPSFTLEDGTKYEYLSPTIKDTKTGFAANVVQKATEGEGAKEITIAYRGSEGNIAAADAKSYVGASNVERFNTSDWNADHDLANGDVPRQFQQAVELAKEIKSKYPNDNIKTVGHSLGGGLATAGALSINSQGVSFNGMGINPKVEQHIINNTNNETLNYMDITNYNTKGDLVSDIDNHQDNDTIGRAYQVGHTYYHESSSDFSGGVADIILGGQTQALQNHNIYSQIKSLGTLTPRHTHPSDLIKYGQNSIASADNAALQHKLEQRQKI
jgi:hypothetical protein